MRSHHFALVAGALAFAAAPLFAEPHNHADHDHAHHDHQHEHIKFSVVSARTGDWSNPKTWNPQRVPKTGDRVLVSRGHYVRFDIESPNVIRLLQVAGTLQFARDRDTELNVGILKVQNSDVCSENGFACDFRGVTKEGEPGADLFPEQRPELLVGTPNAPIPAEHTAKIRLHYVEGLDKNDAPALVCCSARMELHGAPLSHTWVKLGEDANPGDKTVTLNLAAKDFSGWQVGDEIIVTGSKHLGHQSSFRNGYQDHPPQTEERVITKIEGNVVHLDQPLKNIHYGNGEFRSEVANLSRNVIIESADPDGVRGHTLYHRHSRGGISYVRLAHLGKEGVLGRYPVHFHLIGNTMRGSQIRGAAIVDSHNRWVTLHGSQYMIVRDCVGYQSVGHGFFLEDGTEVYNLLLNNLGVQAFAGKRLPGQVLRYDPNDGAAFWWANARNSFVGNVACENDQYGFRYDSRHDRYTDANLPILMPDGKKRTVDIRTLGTYRFENNESHTEGLYGVVFAGNNQSGGSINKRENLDRVDRTGPDKQHPHILRGLKIWEVHYALRPQIPQMLMEDITIDHAVYGIYRPMFENQAYRNISITNTSGEPFNRGMDDASSQFGPITVDGLRFSGFYEGSSMPLIQISDNNATGDAASHFRNVIVEHSRDHNRRPWFDRGGGARVDPVTERGVPYYLHDHYAPGRHAKFVTTAAKADLADGEKYKEENNLTGRDTRVAEVRNVEFPKLLEPADDLPPVTVITSIDRDGDNRVVIGMTHDNGDIDSFTVNGQSTEAIEAWPGVIEWRYEIGDSSEVIETLAVDSRGNLERRQQPNP